jgi:predicted KAP-like P-loop ATPase
MKQKNIEVIELIDKDPGGLSDLMIEDVINSLPKSKSKAQDFILKLTEHIKSEILEERELQMKQKKILAQIKQLDPMKALAELKKKIRIKKRTNSQLLLMLIGAKKMAKALGIEINVKQLGA